jgi:hypothetical protein
MDGGNDILGAGENSDFGNNSEQIMKDRNSLVNNVKQIYKLKDILDLLINKTSDKQFSKLLFSVQKIINVISDEGKAIFNREDLPDLNDSLELALQSTLKYISTRLKVKYGANPPKTLNKKLDDLTTNENPEDEEQDDLMGDDGFDLEKDGELGNETLSGGSQPKQQDIDSNFGDIDAWLQNA